MKWKDVAILCRTKIEFDRIEPALASANIPYQVVGGMSFFDRREVKDIMALLAWCVNPNSLHNLSRFCKHMIAGVGENAFDKLYTHVTHPADHDKLLKALGPQKSPKGKAMEAILRAGFQINTMCIPAFDALELLDAQLHILATLQKEDKDEKKDSTAHTRAGSFVELKVLAKDSALPVAEFIDHVALLGKADENTDDNKIVLSTIHAAKGLEWDVVILPAVYKGRLPHFRSTTPEELQQEFNTYYVAKTRAKNTLVISRPLTSADFNGFPRNTEMSPFVRDNLHLIQKIGTVRLLDVQQRESPATE